MLMRENGENIRYPSGQPLHLPIHGRIYVSNDSFFTVCQEIHIINSTHIGVTEVPGDYTRSMGEKNADVCT